MAQMRNPPRDPKVELSEEIVYQKTKGDRIDLIVKLNVWGANLTHATICEKMTKIQILSLSCNCITRLSFFRKCVLLEELYLRQNKIEDEQEIKYLGKMTNMTVLWLSGNPVTKHPTYQEMVLTTVPTLMTLDSNDPNITEADVMQARMLSKQQEEWGTPMMSARSTSSSMRETTTIMIHQEHIANGQTHINGRPQRLPQERSTGYPPNVRNSEAGELAPEYGSGAVGQVVAPSSFQRQQRSSQQQGREQAGVHARMGMQDPRMGPMQDSGKERNLRSSWDCSNQQRPGYFTERDNGRDVGTARMAPPLYSERIDRGDRNERINQRHRSERSDRGPFHPRLGLPTSHQAPMTSHQAPMMNGNGPIAGEQGRRMMHRDNWAPGDQTRPSGSTFVAGYRRPSPMNEQNQPRPYHAGPRSAIIQMLPELNNEELRALYLEMGFILQERGVPVMQPAFHY